VLVALAVALGLLQPVRTRALKWVVLVAAPVGVWAMRPIPHGPTERAQASLGALWRSMARRTQQCHWSAMIHSTAAREHATRYSASVFCVCIVEKLVRATIIGYKIGRSYFICLSLWHFLFEFLFKGYCNFILYLCCNGTHHRKKKNSAPTYLYLRLKYAVTILVVFIDVCESLGPRGPCIPSTQHFKQNSRLPNIFTSTLQNSR
jgi:hypothetical protein